MSEVDSSPEKLKIPENWQFEETDKSLPILQIDLSERYLALRRNYPNYPEEMTITDYFFDRDGIPLIARSFANFSDGGYSINIKERGRPRLNTTFPITNHIQ